MNTPLPTGELTAGDDEPDWNGEELEAAYLRALDALEAVESEVVASAEELAPGRFQELASTAANPTAESTGPGSTDSDPTVQVSAEQIVEACLFVGGSGLTAAKLASVLRGDYTATHVEQFIERLNGKYQQEGRSYEIRLAEGGYHYAIQEDYERIRHKVFGLGPKEVRLSQEALEVLALVAYHQPVTQEQLEELGRPNCGGTLRLLLRRDLIIVQRSPDQPREIRYQTTDRFLSLFGIASLDHLPRPDDLFFK